MIYVICGPTGSGKTSAAIKLAEHFSCPIINADAFQIYQDMNIGTAKIAKDDPYYKKHYLLDIVTPEVSYSVKDYQDIFRKTINDLLKTNKNIIVVGGTGLYIRASFYDYKFEEQHDDTSDLEKMSNEELYSLLKNLDEKACETIHINNRKRVIRAISIARSTTKNKSEWIDEQKHELIYPNTRFLMISPERTLLYENINKRVDEMMEFGLVEETKYLLNKYNLSQTSQQAIGYKEIIAYLNNELSLGQAIELIKQRSRNYAKRQVTYFTHQLPVEIFASKEELLEEIIHE